MFAHAFESAKPATNVGANMHPLGEHAMWHGNSLQCWLLH